MKHQRKILTSLAIFSLFFFTNWRTDCFCGSHADGITHFTVSGSDCCNSQPNAVAYEYSYTQQDNGVWQLISSTPVNGADASDDCCKD